MLEKYLSFTSTIEITCIINVFHISLIGPYDSMTDMNPEKQEVDDEVVDMRHQYQHFISIENPPFYIDRKSFYRISSN